MFLCLHDNFHNVKAKGHSPDEKKNNGHSPDTVLTNSLSIIKLENMHVIDFILSVNRNAKSKRKQNITNDES